MVRSQGHQEECCRCAAQDKAPIVEVLEERLLAASQDRAAAAASAAAAEDAEELAAAQVTVPLRPSLLAAVAVAPASTADAQFRVRNDLRARCTGMGRLLARMQGRVWSVGR